MKGISPQVIAIGGVPMGPGNALLDRYVLAQARGRNPSVCFIATASVNANVTRDKRFFADEDQVSLGHERGNVSRATASLNASVRPAKSSSVRTSCASRSIT
jgi:peptidase E